MAELSLNTRDKIRYVIRRNVKAKDKHGEPCLIAMAFVEHENGLKHTVAIPEGLIEYAGEGVIESEVKLAAARERSR